MSRGSRRPGVENEETRKTQVRPAADAGVPDRLYGFPDNVLKKWPSDEKGEPAEPAFLTRRSGLNLDDEALIAMLDAYGIPCLRRYPGDGDFGRLILGVPASGVDIFVPAVMLEEAKSLLDGGSDDDESGK